MYGFATPKSTSIVPAVAVIRNIMRVTAVAVFVISASLLILVWEGLKYVFVKVS
jgi:hypothetical protein